MQARLWLSGQCFECNVERIAPAADGWVVKTRARRYFRHRQPGLVEQSLGALHAHGARDLQRAGADVTLEQAIEMASADAEPCGKVLDAGAIEGAAADQPHGALHGRARALPGR